MVSNSTFQLALRDMDRAQDASSAQTCFCPIFPAEALEQTNWNGTIYRAVVRIYRILGSSPFVGLRSVESLCQLTVLFYGRGAAGRLLARSPCLSRSIHGRW